MARRSRRGDAHDPAAGVDEWPAREAGIEREVEIQEIGALGPPSLTVADGAHHAPARARATAHGEHDVSHARRLGRDVGDRKISRVDAQNGNVDARVSSSDGRRQRSAIRRRHGDVLIDLHRMIRGDDQSGTPVNAGRTESPSAVDAHGGAPGVLDRRRELVRESHQPVHLGPPLPSTAVFSMRGAPGGWNRPNGRAPKSCTKLGPCTVGWKHGHYSRAARPFR